MSQSYGKMAWNVLIRWVMDIAERNRTIAQTAHDISSPITVVGWFLKHVRANEKILGAAKRLKEIADELKDRARCKNAVISELSRFETELIEATFSIRLFISTYKTDDEETKERKDSSLKAIEKICSMIASLAGKNAVQKTFCDASVVVENAVNEAKTYAREKGISVAFKRERANAYVNANGLNRVIINLINNAIEAGGTKNIHIRMISTDSLLRIETIDNGAGIHEHHITKIFEDGFTHGKVGGSGLGLAYCKRTVEENGGDLAVHSRRDVGTIFAINLPAQHALCPAGASHLSPDDSLWE